MIHPLGVSVNRINAPLLCDYAAEGITVAELLLYAADAPPEAPEPILAYGEETAGRIAGAGLTLRSVHLPFSVEAWNPSHPDPAARSAAVAGQRRLIERCARWGAAYVVLHASCGPVPDEERPDRERLCAQSLKALWAVASDCGVRILAENLPKRSLVNGSAPLLRVTDGGRLAGICMDVNHLFLETHAEFIAKAGALIRSTHFSDYDGLEERHWLPGMGVVPWKGVLRDLAAAGYEGPYLFEVRPDDQGRPYPAKRLAGCLTPYME